jgi:uncharacterized protein YgbK (DUF1537 family)
VQTQVALDHGFSEVSVDPARFLGDPSSVVDYRAELAGKVSLSLASGVHTILTTPPKTEQIPIDGNHLGQELARVVNEVCREKPPERLIVAGGDTSGHVARGIGITSLRVVALMAPGAPLCLAEIAGDRPSSLQVCLKGGQVGPTDYFVRLAGARTSPSTINPQERALQ